MLAKIDDISFRPGKKSYVHRLDIPHICISNIRECQIFPTIVSKKENFFSTRIEYLGPESPAIIIHNISRRKPKNKQYVLKVGWIVVGYGFKSYLNIKFDGDEVPIKESDNKAIAKIERSGTEIGIIGTCVVKEPNYNPENSKIITSLHFHQKHACIYIDIDNIDDKKKFLDHLSICYR